LDGQLIIWSGERLAFDLLQHRFAGGLARARDQARDHSVSYVDDRRYRRRETLDDRRPPGRCGGLMIKGAGTRCEPSMRRWRKYKLRETTELS